MRDGWLAELDVQSAVGSLAGGRTGRPQGSLSFLIFSRHRGVRSQHGPRKIITGASVGGRAAGKPDGVCV